MSVSFISQRRTPLRRLLLVGSKARCSTAAVLEEDQPEEQQQQHRPRLEALRKELRKETQKVQLYQNKTSTISLHDLREKLSVLPDVSPHASLVDKFERHHSYLRLSLVEKCNLRCQYCMPPEGVPLQPPEHLLSTMELLEITKMFLDGGVDKIRLTGGEPLLRRDLSQVIQGLNELNVKQIGMTTNGVTLSKQMDELCQAGLTHVNISLDTLDPTKFLELTRRNAFSKVWRSIEDACHALPEGRVKINVVVMRDCNQDELPQFVQLTRHLPVDVRFIEYMPFFDNGWKTNKFVSYQEMMSSVENSNLSLQRIRDGPNDTTKWWKLDEPSLGRVGFITSMSQHFCGTCNRLRITADGQIKSCLFGSSEISLRDALRQGWSQGEMLKLIHYAVQQKHFALGGHGTPEGIANANDNRPMTLIGG